MAGVSRNPRPLFVTALPSAPSDGMEVFYQSTVAGTGGGATDTMATTGAVWHLRYRSAASGSFKWEFVGGTPTSHQNGGGSTTCAVSFASYAPSSWTSPTVKVPLAGTYAYTLQCNMVQQTSGSITSNYQNLVASTTGTLFNQQHSVSPWNFFGTTYCGGLCGQDGTGNLVANETLSFQQGVFSAGNAVVHNMVKISLTPIRVG